MLMATTIIVPYLALVVQMLVGDLGCAFQAQFVTGETINRRQPLNFVRNSRSWRTATSNRQAQDGYESNRNGYLPQH
jgi:hypothetical protein